MNDGRGEAQMATVSCGSELEPSRVDSKDWEGTEFGDFAKHVFGMDEWEPLASRTYYWGDIELRGRDTNDLLAVMASPTSTLNKVRRSDNTGYRIWATFRYMWLFKGWRCELANHLPLLTLDFLNPTGGPIQTWQFYAKPLPCGGDVAAVHVSEDFDDIYADAVRAHLTWSRSIWRKCG